MRKLVNSRKKVSFKTKEKMIRQLLDDDERIKLSTIRDERSLQLVVLILTSTIIMIILISIITLLIFLV